MRRDPKRWRRGASAALTALLACLLWACEHRELVDDSNLRYVRVYLDEDIRNVTYGFYDETKERPAYQTPRGVCVTLCNPASGEVTAQKNLTEGGRDERGSYLHGHIYAKPGIYNLIAYNYDTEATHIADDDSYQRMTVYTNPIAESLKSRLQSIKAEEEPYTRTGEVRYEPDHVFVASTEGICLERTAESDTLRTLNREPLVARSVTKTYYMQVNVKGAEHVHSAVAYITGMSGAIRLHDRSMVPEMESNIYFGLQNGLTKTRSGKDTHVAYASFNTFGKLPNVEGYIEITFEFNTTDGKVQTEKIRVTDLFETPQVKEQQWIIIDKTIEITPPETPESTGGLGPGVSEWEQVEGEITI